MISPVLTTVTKTNQEKLEIALENENRQKRVPCFSYSELSKIWTLSTKEVLGKLVT